MTSLPAPFAVCCTATFAPSFSDTSISRRRISASCAGAFFTALGLAPSSMRLTSRSVSRTDKPFLATWRAASNCCKGFEIDNKARAWPISSCRSSSIGFTLSERSRSRSRLLTDARERPTAWAASACVRSNSRISRSSARASSSGFRSSRWIFSMSAIAMAASSGISRTTAGMSARPAICAARQRRSPATIS